MATVTRRIRPKVAVAGRSQRRQPTRQIRILVQLSALTAAIIGLWLLWNLTATTVQIEVDGVTESVQTHRRVVGDLLTDVGLLLGPEALVEEVVGDGSRVPIRVTQTHDLNGDTAAATVGTVDSVGAVDSATAEETLRISHNLDTRIRDGLQVSVRVRALLLYSPTVRRRRYQAGRLLRRS